MIDSPEAGEKAQEIADRAVTLVRNSNSLLPLAAPEHACFVVMSENRYSNEGQMFTAQLRRRVPRVAPAALDPSMARDQIDETLGRLTGCQSYAVAAFSSVSEFRGSVGLAGDLPHAMETIAAAGKPVALVALGNPYLLRSFPNVAAYVATFSTVAPSEYAAVKALFGEIRIGGRLPVTIPGLAALGDGIQMAATRTGPPVGPTQ